MSALGSPSERSIAGKPGASPSSSCVRRANGERTNSSRRLGAWSGGMRPVLRDGGARGNGALRPKKRTSPGERPGLAGEQKSKGGDDLALFLCSSCSLVRHRAIDVY